MLVVDIIFTRVVNVYIHFSDELHAYIYQMDWAVL